MKNISYKKKRHPQSPGSRIFSLINGLMNRKSLARTSSQPGKTQTINYYNINKAMYLVDLPGYGYAKVSPKEKEKWGKMVENYLHTSKQLKAVFLLIDIRHEPTTNDKLMYDYIFKTNLPCLVIANKADKIAITKVDGTVEHLQELLNPLKDMTFLPFSSERKVYTEKVWEELEKYF